jgi:uncharacterized membrane protein
VSFLVVGFEVDIVLVKAVSRCPIQRFSRLLDAATANHHSLPLGKSTASTYIFILRLEYMNMYSTFVGSIATRERNSVVYPIAN